MQRYRDLPSVCGNVTLADMNRQTRLINAGTRARQAAIVLAVPALLLFLVAGSVAWAVNDPGLYQNGFQRYRVAARSGITDAGLRAVGAELRHYFNTGTEPLAVRASIYGVEQDVFNQREIHHMYDVKRLVRGTYWVALGSALWVAATLTAGFVIYGRAYVGMAARLATWSGVATLAAVLGVGVAAILSFEKLFLLFHRLSFANDLWMLDPRTDYLLILFPSGFWFDATMRVALTSVLGALLLISLGGAALAYRRWRSYRKTPAAGAPSAEHRTDEQ